jgi:hypothetical protein
MKIYVAARSQEAGRALRDRLISLGHTVTSSWLDASDYGTDAARTPGNRRLNALACDADVVACDALVMIAGDGLKGGRHVELGMALALGKCVYVLGEPENVFHWHPGVAVFKDVSHFEEFLNPKDTP